MKRTDFMQIIKLRSLWKVDKRRGDYKLPNGDRLSKYIMDLVESQMRLDNLGIRENGNLCFCTGGNWNTVINDFDEYTLMPAYENNEICTYKHSTEPVRAYSEREKDNRGTENATQTRNAVQMPHI